MSNGPLKFSSSCKTSREIHQLRLEPVFYFIVNPFTLLFVLNFLTSEKMVKIHDAKETST